ncbi:MAG: hypothetical protein HY821_14525 [Acidobacteria bacterium]|nr:hypothetical protein [Acidobacteriota bacterium]
MNRIITLAIAAAFTFAGANAQFVQNGGRGYGPRDGSGYQGSGPRDGSGYGAKSGKRNGNGTCDGTGPKSSPQRSGSSNRGPRR